MSIIANEILNSKNSNKNSLLFPKGKCFVVLKGC